MAFIGLIYIINQQVSTCNMIASTILLRYWSR
jgi:hypothetical protein